ncbi:MAG: class I SAM-dependent methyltransferase [Nitrospirae bacterium]|nr:class I SAM-dependent methyltransferase [Nitrospirota bacterium]
MSEAIKCKHRIQHLLVGKSVLDIGTDDDKVCPWAIGVDLSRVTEQVNLVGNATNLYWFRDGVFDVVFSSHTLEDIDDTDKTLREWLRVLKSGGHLILYLPHKDFYPNIGQPYANAGHKHDFYPEDIMNVIDKIGVVQMIYSNVYCEKFIYELRSGQEYSFEQVYRKI